jgi:streptogramin lyase
VGPDGNLWFTEHTFAQIGRMTPAGVVTAEFPADGLDPNGITAGPDGNLWFAVGNKIGRITPAGAVTVFPLANANNLCGGITAGPDGNLWFTEELGDQIGQITPAGLITEFPLPTGSAPVGITAGPDGNVWFTESGRNQIGRITTLGLIITEFAVPTANSGPTLIAAGPDGNLWFTEFTTNQIGRISTAGVVSAEFPTPTNSAPDGITAGPDGNLWFTEVLGNQIGRITPAGVITEFPVPTAHFDLEGIAAGPDGNLWFTEPFGSKIGRLDLPLAATGSTVNASEGMPFSGVVATFTDADPSALPSDYTTTISWGDGTTSAGQCSEDASGVFYFTGSHTYADEGSGYAIAITIHDEDGSTTTASSTANVVQMPLLPVAALVIAAEGSPVPAGTLVATFTDTGGADPTTDYSATVSWGDGSAPAPALVAQSAANWRRSRSPHWPANPRGRRYPA